MDADGEERQVGDEEFRTLTNDDAKARMLRKMMTDLARGEKGDPIAEMARDVMSGRKGVRESIDEIPRIEETERRFADFRERWDSMPEKDRFAAEKKTRDFLQEQRAEIEEESSDRSPGRQAGRHSGRGWSLY